MSYVQKKQILTVIPGNPGTPATAGSPAVPARCVTEKNCSPDSGHWEYEYIGTKYVPDGCSMAENPPAGTPKCTAVKQYAKVWVSGTSVEDCDYVTTCTPERPAVPPSPGVPPTPTQIDYSNNRGWNTWSRSIYKLGLGQRFTCKIPDGGFESCALAVGLKSMLGHSLGSFKNSVIVDLGGVLAADNGSVNSQVHLGSPLGGEVRITRQENGRLVYSFCKGSVVKVVEGADNFSMLAELYVFTYLRVAPDMVEDSDITNGEVQYGAA